LEEIIKKIKCGFSFLFNQLKYRYKYLTSATVEKRCKF
jgi:hypothetical protein